MTPIAYVEDEKTSWENNQGFSIHLFLEQRYKSLHFIIINYEEKLVIYEIGSTQSTNQI